MTKEYSYYFYGMKWKSDIDLSIPESSYHGEPDVEIYNSWPWDPGITKSCKKIIIVPDISDLNEPPAAHIYQIKDNTFLIYTCTGFKASIIDGKVINIVPHDVNTTQFSYLDMNWLVTLISSFLLKLKDTYCLHAGTISKNNKTICILGDSGAGKSTMCALALKNGFYVQTDDIMPTILKDDDKFYSISGPPIFKLSPESKKFLGEIDIKPTAIFEEYKAAYSLLDWNMKMGWEKEDCTITAYVTLERDPTLKTGEFEYFPLSNSEGFRRIMASSTAKWYNPPGTLMRVTEHFNKMANSIPGYKVKYANGEESLNKFYNWAKLILK